jgi:hypothetical protein
MKNLKIEFEEEKQELLRGIKLCKNYAIPMTSDLLNIENQLRELDKLPSMFK